MSCINTDNTIERVTKSLNGCTPNSLQRTCFEIQLGYLQRKKEHLKIDGYLNGPRCQECCFTIVTNEYDVKKRVCVKCKLELDL